MKNITVSVDEETHRLVRIRAAELDTSVSALDDIHTNHKGFRAADNLPREELYDRARARAEADGGERK